MSSCGFAALADAVIKSGVNPELLVRLEEDELHSLWLVRKRVQDEALQEEYKSSLSAVLAAAGICAIAKQPSKRARKDLPFARPSQRGSLSSALNAALPENQEDALAELFEDIWARSLASGDARWRTWTRLCRAWRVDALPLTILWKPQGSYRIF